ncbi:MAG: OFA family MFS transporter [Candidatus Brocadiae bacterium]|nr:OFA family MFS transporter [Candidatus Brocadiia bacterium]
MGDTQKLRNRWLIAIMGTLLQLCLGTVYAWSYFQKLFVDKYNWDNVTVAWIFCLAIFFLGASAAVGGIILPKVGPRRLAMTGGFCFGLGYLVSAYAISLQNSLTIPLFYIGYGAIGGTGLGLGYVTPVATVAKWFPDKKGLATGMVVMGFGLGALIMSKILAPNILAYTSNDFVMSFVYIGVIFTIIPMLAGSFLVNPPAGYVPQGYNPPAPASGAQAQKVAEKTASQCVLSGQFFMMWAIFFCNITAGIAIIGFQSPMIQDLFKKFQPELTPQTLTSYGATLIAVSAIFNGLGRFFWGSVSDKIGRVMAFRLILGTQIAIFAVLLKVENPWIFGALICYIFLCYGGGFGTMPSFVSDVFGSKLMAVVYGFVLTAWSIAGIAGPQIFAYIKDQYKPDNAMISFYSLSTAAAFLAVGFIVSLIIKKEKAKA